MTKSVYWRDIAFPGDIADLRSIGNEGLIVPGGATAERPLVPENGTIRYNSTAGFLEVYQSAAWSTISTTGISGEANTASNLGAGQPIFASKSGFDLRFRSITAGPNVTIGSNANEIIISATGTGEVNTASNLGVGTGNVFNAKVGPDLQFKSLRSLNPNLSIVDNASTIDFDFLGGVGETNNGANLGGGVGVFSNKVGTNLRFRTLTNTGNEIALVTSSSEIEIGLADNPVIPGTASMVIPSGPTGSEPAPLTGMIRYDTTSGELRAVIGGVWQTVETSVGTFLPLGGGTMVGNIQLGAGVGIIGGVGSQITLQSDMIMLAGANIDMTAGGSIQMQAGSTVDGRDLSEDGIVLDSVNPTGLFGFVTRTTDPGTFAPRTITGTSDQIFVTNGDGVAGNPVLSIPDNPVFTGTGSVTIPSGTSLEQPAVGADGMVRINNDEQSLEFYSGGAWIQPISTIGGAVTGGDIDMGGNNITNVNLTDGRDLSTDGVTIDALTGITDDTGVVVKSGGTLVSRLVQPTATPAFLGGYIANGNGSAAIEVGVDINGQAAFSPLIGTEEFLIYDTIGATNAKVSINDVVTFIGSTGLDAEVDVTAEFGLVARVADGVVGDFERRSIVGNTTVNREGIEILEGQGVGGNPTIGLALDNLPVITSIAEADEIVFLTNGTATNSRANIANVRGQILGGVLRASNITVPVVAGVSVLPFSIGAGDFDPNSSFIDISDSYTPVAGTYRISAYLEVDATTVAGRYTMRIRRNGTPEGNIGVLVADGTNADSIILTDSFIANGTDAFTVEINNASGGASTLATVRFYAERIN